ncbi:hypothetical protein [Acetivibrio ethanolgignens]|nr:hypothetical protein [Acetivibrio ethanolgignens]
MMHYEYYLRRVARKKYFEKWILETKNDNDEWNYDLVFVDLDKDCTIYLFTSKEEFLKSEEYMTVLEGLCHDWCTFDGINNDIKSFLLPSDIIEDDDKIDIFVKEQIGDVLEKVKE